ncbi:MAG: hypothetical protein BGN98_00850 [Microbacterium sp. 69-7]|uniref:hypothetical protein n=1 Tax=Microbacterium sp. 69-7 TaxID=1895784 RepID=UPI00095F1E04|nr:hypothetical protein [Microbacterium sp. 69-7]OJU45590.1 MAG: hypothetical protein BGN98_00850 [Microbacterium sp. 69-7]
MAFIATIVLALASVLLVFADGPISRRRDRDKISPLSPVLSGLSAAASVVALVAAAISIARAFGPAAQPGDDLAIAVTIVAFVAFVCGFAPALAAVRPRNRQTWGTWAATVAFLASGVVLTVGAASDLAA